MRMIYSMKRKVALVAACIMCSLTASAAGGDVASVTVGGTTTSYDTFDAAITAAQSCTDSDKAVVKLLADIAMGDTYLAISGGVFTIDLNGFELSSTGSTSLLSLTGSANVTIIDSGAGGAIRTNSTAIRARDTSIVTIDGGIIQSADSYPIWFQSTGKLTVNDGVIIGGSYGICSTKGITTINGGSFTGGSYAVYGYSSCSATINGGEFSGGEYDLGGMGSVKVNDATFPEGLSVKDATLNAILGSGYAYWAGDTMLAPADDATEITDKGDITVKAACTHESGTKSYTNNGDDHTYTYSCCNLTVTEDHSEVADDGDCTTAVICPNCDGTIIGAKTSHDWSGKDGICTVCNHVCDHIGHTNPIYTATNNGNVITESCSKCKVSLGTATITATNATYDGTAQETATVAYDTGWTGDRNLTVTYANNVDAGTATASITLGGVTARTTFTIQPKEITGAAVAIEQGASFVYSGEPFTPAVSVTLDGKPLAASDYQVSYAGNVNAGQAMVTVTGRGNYSGSATASFTIAKAPAPTLPVATVSRNYAVAKVSVPTGIVAGEGSSVPVGTASGSGSDKVAAVALDAKGNLTFTLSGGANGDEIVLPVHLHSPNYEGPITATVTVTLTDKLDQRPLTVKATSTVPSGGTLELSIGGGSGKGAVTYEVINGTGSASLSGSTLTGGAPGTVMVIATKAGTSQYNPARSQPLVITIE